MGVSGRLGKAMIIGSAITNDYWTVNFGQPR
jgi:hypothetical protein